MKTVFVLGAGSSVPYGFPTGDGLREFILGNFLGGLDSTSRITERSGKDLIARFRDSGLSIDKFTQVFSTISKDPEQVLTFSRLAIVDALTAKESDSFFNEGSLVPSGDWYRTFVQKIFEGVHTKEDYARLTKENVFLTFAQYRHPLHFCPLPV